jgi:hypothetical protein
MVREPEFDPEPVVDLGEASVFFPLSRRKYLWERNLRGNPSVSLLYLDKVVRNDRLDLASDTRRRGFASSAALLLIGLREQGQATVEDAPKPKRRRIAKQRADDEEAAQRQRMDELTRLIDELADELTQVAQAARQFDAAQYAGRVPAEHPYKQTEDGIRLLRPGPFDTVIEVAVTNFTTTIVKETVLDPNDDLEPARQYTLDATVAGRPFTFVVTAEEFHTPTLLARLGAQAVVFVGGEPHLRPAIKLLSGAIPQDRVLAAPGWWRLDSEDVFVTAAGGISASGFRTDLHIQLDPPFDRYELAAPPSGAARTAAVAASLRLRQVAPDRTALPALAFMLRPPLDVVTYGMHLHGRSGLLKTAFAALLQGAYGATMDAAHLPAGWQSTANALEQLAYRAKDVLLVVDDAVPAATARGQQELGANFERVFRAVGNRTARRRLRADSSARPAFVPRGGVLSTGEVGIDRESLLARVVSLAFRPGDIDVAQLTVAQQEVADGLYAAAMAAWICWLAQDLDTIRTRFRARRPELRARFAGHHRLADNLADLLATLELFAEFAAECGALADRDAFVADAEAALLEVAAPITQAIAAEAVAVRFITLLQAALSSGAGHVERAHGHFPPEPAALLGWGEEPNGALRANGRGIGWVDGQFLYLIPAAAVALAQELAGKLGQPLPAGETTIAQRLDDAGLLCRHDAGRLTTKVPVAGGRRRCWVLALATIVDAADTAEESGA